MGPTGKVYGLDMTDEMLAVARENQAKAKIHNVEFLKGEIESIPLADATVNLIISNCVINLSPGKDRVFAEAYRVLKPGGRLAISDIVVRGSVQAQIRKNLELWAGCVAGALEESDYRAFLAKAGFDAIEIVPTRVYSLEDARGFLSGAGLDVDAVAPRIQDRFMSAFIRHERAWAASNIDSFVKGVDMERTRDMMPVPAQRKRLGVFERYLSVWVGLCMVFGVLLGQLTPQLVQSLRKAFGIRNG